MVDGSRLGEWAGQVNKSRPGRESGDAETEAAGGPARRESAGIKAADGKGSQWSGAIPPSIHHYKIPPSPLPPPFVNRKVKSHLARGCLRPTPLRAAPLHSLSALLRATLLFCVLG
jgi:hypothetical protein